MMSHALPWVGYWVAKYGSNPEPRHPLYMRTVVRIEGGEATGVASQADAPLVSMLRSGLRVTLGPRRAHWYHYTGNRR